MQTPRYSAWAATTPPAQTYREPCTVTAQLQLHPHTVADAQMASAVPCGHRLGRRRRAVARLAGVGPTLPSSRADQRCVRGAVFNEHVHPTATDTKADDLASGDVVLHLPRQPYAEPSALVRERHT